MKAGKFAAFFATALLAFQPPVDMSGSQWASENYYLSAESAAEPGRFRPFPYQVEILDAITDDEVEEITFMKSARVGATKMMNAGIGYYLHQDPCPILVVQPTVEDAEGYSKEEVAPMLRDSPVLAELVGDAEAKDTILHKLTPGGSVSMVGANSGRGFRRVSRKFIVGDERDAYPRSAGSEGDPWKLAKRRAEFYHDRKFFSASTPLDERTSAIAADFKLGTQEYFEVPCPHCGHFDRLVFKQREEGGHWMRWPKDRPHEAHFVCSDCGTAIEHSQKREIVGRGRFVAQNPDANIGRTRKHRSFHIWAAYSYSPNASWGQIAREFVEAEAEGVHALKTFVNTVLGETWKEKGEAPDWRRLYNRREHYKVGTVPDGVEYITCGVDVQRDRFVFEIVGWGEGMESWSIDAASLWGDTSDEKTFEKLDDLLETTWDSPQGPRKIDMLAIDSGAFTQMVYNWARRHSMRRVIAVKGVHTARTLISTPSPVDVMVGGRKLKAGFKVWPVAPHIAKTELYGWLKLETREGEAPPPGYCHFPEHGETYFQEVTAEQLMPVTNNRGFTELQWQQLPNRENHFLDCRVYNRCAASLLGADRRRGKRRALPSAEGAAPAAATQKPAKRRRKRERLTKDDGFYRGSRRRRDGGDWFS